MVEIITTRIQDAQQALGVTFRDPELLRLALVHSSLLNEPEAEFNDQVTESNERLEFLGDAVLGLVVAEYLYQRFPDSPEGRLTVYRAALVRRETLARWARELGLGDLLLIGRGEIQAGGISQRILAGTFEAVIGALYLDQGLAAVRSFMAAFLDRDVERALATDDLTNYKGLLQEHIQQYDTVLPTYVVVSQEGPDHERNFVIEARHRGQVIGTGSGRSKRAAEQAAARDALMRLSDAEESGVPIERCGDLADTAAR
ncbi:MAG TPA: ribonuclease III [Thermomicrobiales bacterium]|nr:ribonuclease III [Thermomicrobiales bacterium]